MCMCVCVRACVRRPMFVLHGACLLLLARDYSVRLRANVCACVHAFV